MTYRDLFDSSLQERIAAGGRVGDVVAAVNAYQGADRPARETLFQEWIRLSRPNCGRCRSAFEPRPDRVTEDDEILCDWCTYGYLGATGNPLRGVARWR